MKCRDSAAAHGCANDSWCFFALTADQRADLERLTRQKSIGVAKKRWATILLLADESHPDGQRTDEQIAAEVAVSVRQ